MTRPCSVQLRPLWVCLTCWGSTNSPSDTLGAQTSVIRTRKRTSITSTNIHPCTISDRQSRVDHIPQFCWPQVCTVTLNKMNLTLGATESFLASLNPFKFPVLWQSIKAKSAFQSSKGSTFEIYLTAIYCVPRLFWTFFGSKNQVELAKPWVFPKIPWVFLKISWVYSKQWNFFSKIPWIFRISSLFGQIFVQNISSSGLFWAKKSVFIWQIIEFLNDLLEFFENLLEFFWLEVFWPWVFFKLSKKKPGVPQEWPWPNWSFSYKKIKESDILVRFTSQKMLEVPAKKITSQNGFQPRKSLAKMVSSYSNTSYQITSSHITSWAVH